MREYDVGIVPVVSDPDSRNLIGLITDRDIAVRHVADSHMEACTVGTHMTRDDIETVEENDDTAPGRDRSGRHRCGGRDSPRTSGRRRQDGLGARSACAVTSSRSSGGAWNGDLRGLDNVLDKRVGVTNLVVVPAVN
jgi:CBS domain-containing protein